MWEQLCTDNHRGSAALGSANHPDNGEFFSYLIDLYVPVILIVLGSL
jgi:hypothetical protein